MLPSQKEGDAPSGFKKGNPIIANLVQTGESSLRTFAKSRRDANTMCEKNIRRLPDTKI